MATPASPIVPSPVTPATDTLPTSPGADPMDVDAQPVKKEEETLTADQVKEKGNVAFKAGRYGDAIDLYSKAIEMNPLEPSYLTNRAASYMALKRFKPALADCQSASTLQSSSPSAKTLLRLARCQLALGSPIPALSTLRTVLSLAPSDPSALQLQTQATQLVAHLENFQSSKEAREWGMARIALDKAIEACDGGSLPIQWRLWKVELELARKRWDDAMETASDALRISPNEPDVQALRGLVLFLTNRVPQATQHAQSALRLDPEHKGARVLLKRTKEFEKLKEAGNSAFKTNQLLGAVDKYGQALEVVGEKEEEGGGGCVRAILLSNRATALFKLDKYQEALADVNASLTLLPTSFKALRTRARIQQTGTRRLRSECGRFQSRYRTMYG